MRPIHIALPSLALTAALVGLTAWAGPSAEAAPLARAGAETETYKVDAGHSFVTFKVRHMGVGEAWGRFNELTGSFTFDEADPSQNSVSLVIEAKSIDTANGGRDKHLRGSDFFNVEQFPKITFTSTSVKKLDDGVFEVTGEIEVLGKKQPVTTQVELIGRADTGRQGFRAGFSAGFTLKRSDFGMNYGIEQGALGDAVEVMVSLEGVKG
jgi:polyisoprenoid-binding protein YceI